MALVPVPIQVEDRRLITAVPLLTTTTAANLPPRTLSKPVHLTALLNTRNLYLPIRLRTGPRTPLIIPMALPAQAVSVLSFPAGDDGVIESKPSGSLIR